MSEIRVKLIDVMGNDLKVANAARRSLDSHVDEFGPGEEHLLKYLARGLPSDEMNKLLQGLAHEKSLTKIRDKINKYRSTAEHWTPFAHCFLTFEVDVPIFVARQLIRHTVGVTISEMSRRYVSTDPDFWLPGEGEWRMAGENVKQGSGSEVLEGLDEEDVMKEVARVCDEATKLYQWLVNEKKVAPELARMILPQNVMTNWHWTVSLVTAARICKQRLDSHAQKEIQIVAQQINTAAKGAFPVAWPALMSYGSD